MLGSTLGTENMVLSKTGTVPLLAQFIIYWGERDWSSNHSEKYASTHSDKWHERKWSSVKRTWCKEIAQAWRLWKPRWRSDVWAQTWGTDVTKVLGKDEKGGDNPGRVFVGGRGGHMQIWGSARQPVSLQYGKGGEAEAGSLQKPLLVGFHRV